MKICLPTIENNEFYTLSLSGGVDSISLAHFLKTGRKRFTAIHFDHKTKYAPKYRAFVEQYCGQNEIDLTIYEYIKDLPANEHAWAKWRKGIMTSLSWPVLTAHHKDDVIESYLMGRKLCYQFDNIARPFLHCTKAEILKYARSNGLTWIEDPTNQDPNFCRRNKIRNQLIPLMRECGINPENLLGVQK